MKNTYKEGQLADPKITSEAEFDTLFGMATTMGENGKQTVIDFNTQYIIAVIRPVTNQSTSLTVNSLQQIDSIITLHYTETAGEKQPSSTQPLLLLVVDNQYQGAIQLKKN